MISLTPEQFEALVSAGIDAIPEKFLKKLDNVAITIDEAPTKEQLVKNHVGRGYTLFGLYEGVPQIKRWNYGGGILPDKITIFRKPILTEADSAEEVKEIVRNTVWHEIAHHFGMDEGEVRDAESKRAAAKRDNSTSLHQELG